MLEAEFTVEPFTPGAPGPHVLAAVQVAAESNLDTEFGPFGTNIRGDDRAVLDAVDAVSRAAIAHGATSVSTQIRRT